MSNYQICEPKPYHINCNISKSRPSIIVCLLPSVFISGPKRIWAPTLNIPTTAMNTATMAAENPIASFR